VTHTPLVLASRSPRRAQILELLGIEFEVHPSSVEERPLPGESPRTYAERLARDKAQEVMRHRPGRYVLAGDTIVVLDERILEKPDDDDDAVTMLLALSGRSHEVLTGMALGTPSGELHSLVAASTVWFRGVEVELARAYVRTGEPMDKAGAYGIQGRGAALVERVEGDFYTVMGLSVSGLVDLLAEGGRPYRFPLAPEES
jgi:septum formation protein